MQGLIRRAFVYFIPFFVLLLSTGTAQAAHEFPAQDQIMSGNNVVSGWFCSALRVTIQFDNFSLVDVPYGGQRNDTIPACGDADNGYASIFPYPALGPGLHRLRVRVDGVVRADITFTVVTFDVEFLSGVTGEGRVTLSNGQEAMVRWSEAVQGFIVVAVTDGPASDFSETWFFDIALSSNSCSFIGPTELDPTSSGLVLVTQVGSSITLQTAPDVIYAGDVGANGAFVVSRITLTDTIGTCSYEVRDAFEGNFLTGVLANVTSFDRISGSCSGFGVPCSHSYTGTISALSPTESG